MPRRQRHCISVTVYADDKVLSRVLPNFKEMSVSKISAAIAKKLAHAAEMLGDYAEDGLAWRPVSQSSHAIEVELESSVHAALLSHADRLGFALEVLFTTVLFDPAFVNEPSESAPEDRPLGYLRTERGRGRIYGMYFEMPGYQYAFLRLLGRDDFSAREILDHAFSALAREVVATSQLGGFVVSSEALGLGARMLKLEDAASRAHRRYR